MLKAIRILCLLIHFPGASLGWFLSGEHHRVVLEGALWGIGLGMVVPVWSTGHVYAAWIPLENAVGCDCFWCLKMFGDVWYCLVVFPEVSCSTRWMKWGEMSFNSNGDVIVIELIWWYREDTCKNLMFVCVCVWKIDMNAQWEVWIGKMK